MARPKKDPLDIHLRNAMVFHAVQDELAAQSGRKSFKAALAAIAPRFAYLRLSADRLRKAFQAGKKLRPEK